MTAASIQSLCRAARAGDDPTAAIDALLERGYTENRARRACGLRILCPYCRAEIDPEVCHCGMLANEHTIDDGHHAVPMGCVCHQLDDGAYRKAVLRVMAVELDATDQAIEENPF